MRLVWLDRPVRPRILVLGDLILDRFVHGDAARISPEAPVPVVRQSRIEHRLGGAANVAANVCALGGETRILGVVGTDAEGERLRKMIGELGVAPEGVLALEGRPTTVKTRVIARHQQVLRVDVEEQSLLDQSSAGTLETLVMEAISEADALIVSDYAKGVVSDRLLRGVLGRARELGHPTVIDPKSVRLERYAPATVVTPNEAELARSAGRSLGSTDEVERVARDLLGRAAIETLVVTLGEKGMLVVPSEGKAELIEARAREVFDVTGAGDTVTAALAIALAVGLSAGEAARVGNAAAAVAVSKLGTYAVSAADLEALGSQ